MHRVFADRVIENEKRVIEKKIVSNELVFTKNIVVIK
jgi:hypothetical protein